MKAVYNPQNYIYSDMYIYVCVFNFFYRILSALELFADAYPTPSSSTRQVTRDSFRFLLVPDSLVGNDITLSAAASGGQLSITDEEEVSARVELSNVDSSNGLVFGVYSTPSLFIRRPGYLEMNNRTRFVLGSTVVVSVRYRGDFSRVDLGGTPVMITLQKSAQAVQNGTRTECSFWDQSLDGGYGAWSSNGCRLLSETRNEAVCECDHLAQFSLVVVSEWGTFNIT